MITRAAATNPWDVVEHHLLTAVQRPVTAAQVTDTTGLPPDTVKSQLETFRESGLVISVIDSGVRFQLTLAGRRRLIALTASANTPDTQAA